MSLKMNFHLQRPEFNLKNTDNLHRIAISNLHDEERSLVRWWCNKYSQPSKPLQEHCLEEIYIEHLEDYYSEDPKRVDQFNQSGVDDDWDGSLDPETERELVKRWEKIHAKMGTTVDISKYQVESDKDLTDEQVKKILDNVGKDLPGSWEKYEFDEKFLGGD